MQVRLGEKETLDATLAFFEERYDKLASLEFYQVTSIGIQLHPQVCHYFPNPVLRRDSISRLTDFVMC